MMSRFALERWSFEARAAGMSSDQASSVSRSEACSLRGVSSAGWPRRGRGARAAVRPSTSRPLRTVLAAEIDRNGLSSVIGTVAAASMPLVEKSHAHRAYCRSQNDDVVDQCCRLSSTLELGEAPRDHLYQ